MKSLLRLVFVLALIQGAAQAALTRDAAGFWIARPTTPNGVLFLLYPGGLVPPTAYAFIAEDLATQGVTTVIPEEPFNLAIFDYAAAERARLTLEARGERWRKVIHGGHSLGGAMAGWMAAWGARVDGLVMLAAYPALDCSKLSVPTLSIGAANDGLISPERLRQSLAQLPAGARLEIIPGGVHAFFGRYGAQSGDGTPTSSREDFETRLLGLLREFFKQFSSN